MVTSCAIYLGNGIGADAAASKVIENSTGNKRDDHHDADDGKEADEKHSLNAALSLQESNHLPMGSEKIRGEVTIINQRPELAESREARPKLWKITAR